MMNDNIVTIFDLVGVRFHRSLLTLRHDKPNSTIIPRLVLINTMLDKPTTSVTIPPATQRGAWSWLARRPWLVRVAVCIDQSAEVCQPAQGYPTAPTMVWPRAQKHLLRRPGRVPPKMPAIIELPSLEGQVIGLSFGRGCQQARPVLACSAVAGPPNK
jgi:hypothetical protein